MVAGLRQRPYASMGWNFTPATKAHPALLVDDLAALKTRLDEADVAVVVDQSLPGFDRFYLSVVLFYVL